MQNAECRTRNAEGLMTPTPPCAAFCILHSCIRSKLVLWVLSKLDQSLKVTVDWRRHAKYLALAAHESVQRIDLGGFASDQVLRRGRERGGHCLSQLVGLLHQVRFTQPHARRLTAGKAH